MTTAIGIPYPVPSPWRVTDMPGTTAKMLVYRSFNGLVATASLEEYTTQGDNPPLGLPGRYVRVVMSRERRYPGWDEMRDFIRSCNLFDRERDVFMLLPPDREYVNVMPNAFHWWQRVADSGGGSH